MKFYRPAFAYMRGIVITLYRFTFFVSHNSILSASLSIFWSSRIDFLIILASRQSRQQWYKWLTNRCTRPATASESGFFIGVSFIFSCLLWFLVLAAGQWTLRSSDKLAVGIRAASPAWLSGAFPRSMGSDTPRIPCRASASFSRLAFRSSSQGSLFARNLAWN